MAMQPDNNHDVAGLLEEWTNRVANLPNEITFMQEEIEHKDRLMNECLTIITKNDNAIQKWIRVNGSHVPNPKEEVLSKAILDNFDRAQILQEEKLALAQKVKQVMDKHTRWLDGHIKTLQDRGEMQNDPDLPSLLRPQPAPPVLSGRVDNGSAQMPLAQMTTSAAMPPYRHPNQYPQRVPAHMQSQHTAGVSSSSAPTTPAAASLLISRQNRETSLGANPPKRLKTGTGALPPSGLARQSSATPGTPRGHTPATVRAGSAGPKGLQKGASKKVAPSGSRQAGAQKKIKKSNLSRVKGMARKKSPSSLNDSELSDAESGSAEEEDENATPPAHKDFDGDEEMGDDEDGGDDKKYCVCQSVSYGDMVACDNDSCDLEWFHWSFVGLKSEPIGVWICPVCTKNGKK